MTNPVFVCKELHIFDLHCIEKWAKKNNTCPLCHGENTLLSTFQTARLARRTIEIYQNGRRPEQDSLAERVQPGRVSPSLPREPGEPASSYDTPKQEKKSLEKCPQIACGSIPLNHSIIDPSTQMSLPPLSPSAIPKQVSFPPPFSGSMPLPVPASANPPAASKRSDAAAQYNQGLCFFEGKGVTINYEQAVLCFRTAAEQGLVNAQHMLGICLHEGKGVAQNHIEAVSWYRKAAEGEFPNAQYSLGECYLRDIGEIGINHEQAIFWIKKAAEKGLPKAQAHLGVLYYHGHGELVPQNRATAISWFRRAARREDPVAKHYLTLAFV